MRRSFWCYTNQHLHEYPFPPLDKGWLYAVLLVPRCLQEGYLEATAMQIAGPGCSSVSLASAGTDSEGADIPRGRKLVLAPIGTAPTVSSSVHEPNAVPPIGEGAGQETSLPR